MMPEFTTVAKVSDIPDGEARAFPVNGRMIAVFHTGGEFTAINDSCPHMGASLAGGFIEDRTVTCPWHAWRFCVQEGTWKDNPKAELKTDCYEVRIDGENVQICVPEDVSVEADE